MDDSRSNSLQPIYRFEVETKHRFSYRPKRISRRSERDRFTFFLVPVVWLLAVLGVVMLGIAALHDQVVGEADWSSYSLAAVPLLGVLVLVCFRVIRGHHYDALNEP
jgi:cell division protein FtsW (lipid II flippase)